MLGLRLLILLLVSLGCFQPCLEILLLGLGPCLGALLGEISEDG